MKTLLSPKPLLHLEGAMLLACTILAYAHLNLSWSTFLLTLLLPDIAMLGYLVTPKLGSWLYNVAHTTTLPLLIGAFAFAFQATVGMQIALIWLAHIGADRMIGYGLKYSTNFKDTHMEHI